MRILLKILAAPFVLVLTLLVAALSFLVGLSSAVLSAISFVLALLAVLCLWDKEYLTGGMGLLTAFAISPYGLPALAEWIIDRLDGLNYNLRCFITE